MSWRASSSGARTIKIVASGPAVAASGAITVALRTASAGWPLHGGSGLDQHMQRQALRSRRADLIHRIDSALHVGQRFDLGNHQMAQRSAGAVHDGGDVGRKSGMINGVHAHCNTGRARSGDSPLHRLHRQFRHHQRVLMFTAHGSTVLAVQRHIKHAGAKLLAHLGLQLQALAHAHFDPGIVVADRQSAGRSLRPQ